MKPRERTWRFPNIGLIKQSNTHSSSILCWTVSFASIHGNCFIIGDLVKMVESVVWASHFREPEDLNQMVVGSDFIRYQQPVLRNPQIFFLLCSSIWSCHVLWPLDVLHTSLCVVPQALYRSKVVPDSLYYLAKFSNRSNRFYERSLVVTSLIFRCSELCSIPGMLIFMCNVKKRNEFAPKKNLKILRRKIGKKNTQNFANTDLIIFQIVLIDDIAKYR